MADALVANSSYATQIEEEAALTNAQQQRYELANRPLSPGRGLLPERRFPPSRISTAPSRAASKLNINKLASQISLYQALGGGWK